MKQNTQLKHSLIYGGITGGVISLFLLILFIFGMNNSNKLVSFTGIFFLAGGYISTRHYRDRVLGGKINFRKAYGTTLLTFIFTGVVWAIYAWVLYKYLSPGLLEERILESQDSLLRLGWSEDVVESMTTINKPSASGIAFGYAFYAALFGALLALPIAAILKRQENPLLKNEE